MPFRRTLSKEDQAACDRMLACAKRQLQAAVQLGRLWGFEAVGERENSQKKSKAPDMPRLLSAFGLRMRTGETVRCARWWTPRREHAHRRPCGSIRAAIRRCGRGGASHAASGQMALPAQLGQRSRPVNSTSQSRQHQVSASRRYGNDSGENGPLVTLAKNPAQ
jgi:hypothetical protein